MAHCGILLKRDFPGLYEKAKSQALADVANGFQAADFKTMAAQARNASSHAIGTRLPNGN